MWISKLLASSFIVGTDAWDTEVTTLWPTIIEIVNITESHGGPESDSFSQRLAAEAIRKWDQFVNVSGSTPDRMNDEFYHYQRAYFDKAKKNFASSGSSDDTFPITWPELQDLPEYRQLRHHIARFGKRYLQRMGYNSTEGFNIFSWAAVHTDADFHGPHTHTGELLVGVYYARTTRTSGRLRLFDPRGQIPPFGKFYDFSCEEGQMIFFPSWLQHAALTTKLPDDAEGRDGNERVIFAFNIGIGTRRGDMQSLEWHKDPISGFSRSEIVHVEDDVKEDIEGTPECPTDSLLPQRVEL
jgi:hypothetical protein